ncbi:MAG: hypothetical protein RLZZ360_934 [Candidatus Parcubacteria bacterium]|jgi:hypothetical protein
MNIQQPTPAPICLTAEKIVAIRCPQHDIERELLIGVADGQRVAIFGYCSPNGEWHSTFVPPEFRSEETLIKLKLDLKFYFGADLITVAGDTINRHPPPRPH